MSSENKKPGDENWNFKIDKEEVNEDRPTTPVSNTGVHRLLNRRAKSDNLDLDMKAVPKTVSRSNAEHYKNTNKHGRKQVASTNALISQRIIGALVDMIVAFILWTVAKTYSDWTFSHALSFAKTQNLQHYLDTEYIYEIIVGINFIPLYLLVFCLPAAFMCKTPGKFIAKTSIDDIDGGDIGMFRTLLRECLYKPISVLSVVGFLMFLFHPAKRALHDILALSIVRRE